MAFPDTPDTEFAVPRQDVWQDASAAGSPVDVRVPPALRQGLEARLRSLGLQPEELVEDLQL